MRILCAVFLTVTFSWHSNGDELIGSLDDPSLNSSIPDISIPALLSSPEKWDSKLIGVLGYLFFDHHGTFLFMTREHCNLHTTSYAIQLMTDFDDKLQELEACSVSYVTGHFEAGEYSDPEPDTVIVRQVPGYLLTQTVRIIETDT